MSEHLYGKLIKNDDCNICQRALETILDLKSCPFCLKIVCKMCLTNAQKENNKKCPMCKTIIPINEWTNYKQLVEFIYNNANNKENSLENIKNNCNIHKSMKLTIYCEPCSIAICAECQFNDHKKHAQKSFEEIAKPLINEIRPKINEIKDEISKIYALETNQKELLKPTFDSQINEITRNIALFKFFSSHISNKQRDIEIKLNSIIKDKCDNSKSDEYKNIKNLIDKKIEHLTKNKETFMENYINTITEIKNINNNIMLEEININEIDINEYVESSTMVEIIHCKYTNQEIINKGRIIKTKVIEVGEIVFQLKIEVIGSYDESIKGINKSIIIELNIMNIEEEQKTLNGIFKIKLFNYSINSQLDCENKETNFDNQTTHPIEYINVEDIMIIDKFIIQNNENNEYEFKVMFELFVDYRPLLNVFNINNCEYLNKKNNDLVQLNERNKELKLINNELKSELAELSKNMIVNEENVSQNCLETRNKKD